MKAQGTHGEVIFPLLGDRIRIEVLARTAGVKKGQPLLSYRVSKLKSYSNTPLRCTLAYIVHIMLAVQVCDGDWPLRNVV